MKYKEVTETVTTYPELDEEEKQALRDNPHTWRVSITKIIVEEFVIDDASSKDEAEYEAMHKSEDSVEPDGSEIETITVDYSELDKQTYQDDEIEYIQEEVLNVTSR
jgi:hypothetical protein|tara:strand:+ start:115 stop:435 length:321 start_codon:yes stop_codon:yes gene_type:complete